MRAPVDIRSATAADLAAVNAVVTAAVLGWDLPERVKRLALPGYCYRAHDLEHIALRLAVRDDGAIVGVAACEPAESPAAVRGLLLHGLYVLPAEQRHGIGARLLHDAIEHARRRGFDGLLTRAQAGAEGFFEQQGMQRLPVTDAARDYGRRYWKPVTAGPPIA